MDVQVLDRKRREVAELWFAQSDLNGDIVEATNGWENPAPGTPDAADTLIQTIFVQSDDGKGPSVKKTLTVNFYPGETKILAAYLPGTTFGQEIEVEGSADWTPLPKEIDFTHVAPKRDALVLLPWVEGTTVTWRDGDKFYGCRDVTAGDDHDGIVQAWKDDAKRLGLPVEDRRQA